MDKKYLLVLLQLSICQFIFGQHVSIAADKMNILYAGVDNPITIAVENYPNQSLVVKATLGNIAGANGRYVFKSNAVGSTEIIVYKKSKSKLIRLGSYPFRIRPVPLPVFKIGSSNGHWGRQPQLAKQQFVRAELEGFDFDVRYTVDSFTVCIVPSDSCSYVSFKNIGNKISEAIRDVFKQLKENDLVLFKEIYVTGPDGKKVELYPLLLTISK